MLRVGLLAWPTSCGGLGCAVAAYKRKVHDVDHYVEEFITCRLYFCRVDQGRTKKRKFDPYVPFFFFALPEGGGGYEDPIFPPLRHIISYANNPCSKSHLFKGQRPCIDRY